MEIIVYNSKINIKEQLIATIGQFDGIHIAHQELIKNTVALAKSKKVKSALFTFDPHPDFILNKTKSFTYLTPLAEKKKIIEQLGIDIMVIIPFTIEVSQICPKDFINNYLLRLNVIELVVGFDFRFGRGGEGNAQNINYLSNNLIKTHIISAIKQDNIKVGSTLIRELLNQGKVEDVKKILGKYYEIHGKVVNGKKIGRTLNIPTANIVPLDNFVGVKSGVYVVRVSYENIKYIGICNIGHNPSFNFQENLTIEVNIFDFNKDIYNQEISIEFISYLRNEYIFTSKEEFLKQIAIDKEKAMLISSQIK